MKVSHVLLVAAAMLVLAPLALAKEENKGPKPVTVAGELVKVETGSIAVAVKKGERAAAETKTIAVDADTRILIETDEMESVPGEGGKMKQKPKIVEGALADLKAGQRVMVGCIADGSKALKILVQRVVAKGGKESDRGGETPAPRKPDGGEKPAPRRPEAGKG
jgi:hypothetical protein